jgi:hypothetical protein
MIAISGRQKADTAISDRSIDKNLLNHLSWTPIQRIMKVSDPKPELGICWKPLGNPGMSVPSTANISTQYYEWLLLPQVKKTSVRPTQTGFLTLYHVYLFV